MIIAAAAPADIVATSIVLVGQIDPTILQPSSLLKSGALTEADISELQYDILAPEVCVARLPWARAVVERDKLIFTTTLQSPAGEPVRDLLLAVIELLPDTSRRFTALGINREQHFGSPSEEAWHSVGHKLVPKDAFWSKLLNKPGTRSISVLGQRDDQLEGNVTVRIEPSAEINPGIYVHVNDHYITSKAALEEDPEHLLANLTEGWAASMRRSDNIIAAVKELADEFR